MPRTVELEPLKKHTLSLYDGDFDELATYYPDIGPSVAVRRIVRAQLKRLRVNVTAAPEQENLDV